MRVPFGSIITDVVNAVGKEFTTDSGLVNFATVVLMFGVLTSRTIWQVVWGFFTLVSFTLLALCRRLPEGFQPSTPEFKGSLEKRGGMIGLTGILSLLVVHNVIP